MGLGHWNRNSLHSEPRGSGHKPQATDACTVYSDRQTLTWRSLSFSSFSSLLLMFLSDVWQRKFLLWSGFVCIYLLQQIGTCSIYCWRRMWANMNGESKFDKNFIVIKNWSYNVVCKADLTILFSFKQEVGCYRNNYCSTLRTLKNISKIIHWCVCVLSHFSHVWLCEILWTAAWQAPLSMGFSRQEYWDKFLCSPPKDLPNPGTELVSLMSLCIGRWVLNH